MDKLLRAARDLGLPLRSEHLPVFQRYYELLVEWNQRFNLTAITDYEQVQVRHFADSLTCLLAAPALLEAVRRGAACRLADVGTGAGFPGLPVKIVWPQARLTLIEAVGKKCTFLEEVSRELGLTNVTVVNARAEEVGRDPLHRESYDVVLARAVAEMAVLAEYCLPLARRQGLVVAQKGEEVEEEVVRAEHAVAVLGGRVERVLRVEVPGTALPRSLVVLRKTSLTPPEYPRRPGVPSRRPLRAV
ncbi:MAG: 16S rRNA (guanine(527)-N(7))-methyltransferase RsmG [Anaerolineae bacterium]|nr:16S rRNA (guanine(527)-N(7))-methyltransferase RsmG [Anaerolineae bacterium]